MKLKSNERNISYCFSKSVLFIRITMYFILLNSNFTFSANTYSQDTKFSFTLNHAKVSDVLFYIEEHSKFIFFYQDQQIDMNRRVNISAKDKNVSEILNQLFKSSGNVYKINDRQIIIGKFQKKLDVSSISMDSNLEKTEQSQRKHIQGTVYDLKGEPIIGANIVETGTLNGTVSDVDGKFSLNVENNAKIQISYIGYLKQELLTKGKTSFYIELKDDSTVLGETVISAFGIGQKKISTVGSIQQIRPAELKVPSSSLSSAFAGRMAGVIAVQRSGEPGADGANFWIRGKSTFSGATGALLILDGVEISTSELNSLDPEVIENFSILKDATATSLYGTRGANGVMIVTTKTGKGILKPIINFRIEGALSQLSTVPEMVDGITYMQLYNEAASRPGSGAIPYSEDKIQGTIDALDPYIYPNVNWYKEMFKKNTYDQRFNVNIRGGSEIMDYFMSISIKHSDGNLNSMSKKFFSYDNNLDIYNYDFVNNLGVKPTSTTKISLGLNLSVKDWKGPNSSPSSIFNMSREANPVDFPVLFPSDKAEYDFVLWGDKPGGPYNDGYRNPMAEYVCGYKTSFNNIITANLKLEQDLDMITKGLHFSGLFSFKNDATAIVTRTSSYNHFELDTYNPETLEYNIKRIGNELGTTLGTSGSHYGDRKMYFQALLNYDQIFCKVHDINIMFLYNHEQYNTDSPSDLYTSLPQRKQGMAGRFSYAFDKRYLAEINFGYNGSENFAKGHRFGFFPSVAIGYNISQERYWEKLDDVISNLKLRASWGLVGNDQTSAGRFAYLEDLSLSGSPSYTTGINQNITYRGPKWARYYNPDLTWEVGEKLNFGMDLQLFHDLNINIDAFKEIRKNIFMSCDGTIPSFIGTGSTKIYSNLGKVQNKGFELSTDYNRQFNDNFFLSFKGTFSFAQNKILKHNEPEFQNYPNLSVVGQPMNVYLCYKAKGLFPDQESIDNSPVQSLGYSPMPGDIWYENMPDYNGNYDNFINGNDRKYMGKPTDPEIVYGFGPSIKYKKFDFSFFFQGVARTSLMMSDFHPFGSINVRGVPDFVAKDRWTEENQNINAKYPRLTIETNSNNESYSSFWLRNGAFLKLRNTEFGYTYKGMRFYVSGMNLLTFSSFKDWDPEMGGGNGLKYPTQRIFNLGFQMTLK